MTVLAADTSAEYISLALDSEGKRYHVEARSEMRHSELLLPVLDSLFSIAGTERESVELVLCPRGPGSWTGLRIGFSACAGIASALRIPCKTLLTTDMTALPYAGFDGTVLAATDAKQSRFYVAAYRGGERVSDCLDASPEEIAKLVSGGRVLIAGSGAALLESRLRPLCPDTALFIEPRFSRGRAPELLDAALAGIDGFASSDDGLVYIRKSDAEVKASLKN